MNKFMALVKLQMKDFFGRAQNSLNIGNSTLAILLQLGLVLVLMIPAVALSLVTYKSFSAVNQPELVITSMYANSVLLMFLFGIPFLASIFFFARDIRFLLSLPIREEVLIFAKLGTVYSYLLAITILLMGPSFVIYGLNAGFTVVYSLLSLVGILLAPLLPLFVSTILVLLVNRIVGLTRRKRLLSILGNFILLIGIIAIQVGINRYISNPEHLRDMMLNKEGLLGIVGLRFPPSIWLTRMITGSLPDTVYFLILNLAFAAATYVLIARVFRRSLLSLSQGEAAGTGKIYYKQRSKGWQLLRRNILIIVSEPTFLLNTVLSLLVPVLMFVVTSVSGQMSLDIFRSPQLKPYVPAVFTAVIVSPAIVGNLSATAITREGRKFWETKVLPISFADNLKYRIMTTNVFSFIGSALLLLLSVFALPLTMKTIIVGTVFCIPTTLFLATVDIIINIYRPLLNWTHPTAAVKNNMNIMISLGIRGVVGLGIYGAFKLLRVSAADLEVPLLIMSGVFFLLYIATRELVYKRFVRKFARISI